MPSRMIFTLKQDGTYEPFDRHKLRGCLVRALGPTWDDLWCAAALSEAVACYLARRRIRCLTSAAVLEIALAALKAVGRHSAAARLEGRHTARLRARSRVTIHHDGGARTAWSKDWLARQAEGLWRMGRTAARIVAGEVERDLLRSRAGGVSRAQLMRQLAHTVAAYGLASPARSPAVRASR